MDANEFIRNCEAHTPEELAPYVGQYVAWSTDGKTLLAHAPELRDLLTQMNQRGPTDYVIDWVFTPEELSAGSPHQ
ncbi:MAG: hypothetical protein IT429_17990 [Gemmataceae bacterium]|nr:hypothetical protein [Gemmataceae bacterium]